MERKRGDDYDENDDDDAVVVVVVADDDVFCIPNMPLHSVIYCSFQPISCNLHVSTWRYRRSSSWADPIHQEAIEE